MISSWLLNLLHLLCRTFRGWSYLLIAISRLWLHFVKRYIPLDFLFWHDLRGIGFFWGTVCPN
jgi:hypothetical protein